MNLSNYYARALIKLQQQIDICFLMSKNMILRLKMKWQVHEVAEVNLVN